MNKRFTLKFFKYLAIFLSINLILTLTTIIFVIFFSFKYIYGDFRNLDPDYFNLFSNKTEPDNHLKNLASKTNTQIYIINNKEKVIYPKNKSNISIKNEISKNINYAHSIPFYKGGYFVFIYKNKSHTSIKNIDDVSTSKLLDSIATQDFNKYRYNLNNNQQISFYKNTNQRPVLGPDEVSTSNDIKGYELYIVLAIFIILDIILALITAYFVSKRLTKPLFFYTDWIKNLSNGKLFKPEEGKIKKRSKKLYTELNESLSNLNDQLLNDRIYQNQINYYKEKWLNQISHDLKSPLTSIYGYSKLIKVADTQKHYQNLIIEKAQYMNKLIESLSTNFDVETSQMKSDKQSFNIQQTINKLISSLNYSKIHVGYLFEAKTNFYGNKLYFERLFMNLIDNSIQHNKFNPSIEIELEKNESQLIINYKDNGEGFDKNINLEDVLERSVTTKRDKKNHGVGFSVIKEAINYHEGEIQILQCYDAIHFKITLKENI
ncbi:sensor histidine kinase [Staphylococcus caprae]|uniref:sensor histidine kinase n=2 Tax=Staphylococcus caprae TaxID=29380 RepID=UPI00254F0AD7|nr:HAMP domain-containing sensor histidine kinase [Staphylococcus caprae]MDK6297873.1 HAMP domain-containing sensor histidine kinase [Staphylococcus caprae]MDK7231706.1 HAMP domain-containing sensor histidine kinase [Staphylococcus caprae]